MNLQRFQIFYDSTSGNVPTMKNSCNIYILSDVSLAYYWHALLNGVVTKGNFVAVLGPSMTNYVLSELFLINNNNFSEVEEVEEER